MQPQAVVSNTLSGSIICQSVLPFGCLQAVCDFCMCINFQCRGPAPRCNYLHTWVRRTLVGSSRSLCAWLSLCLYVSMSGCPYQFLAIIKARPIIARSACGWRLEVLQYNFYSITSYSSVVQSRLYIFLSFCWVIRILFGDQSTWLVIVCSTCIRRSWFQVAWVAV